MKLNDIQKWTDDWNKEQKWSKYGGRSPHSDLGFLMEEAGEVAREVRRIENGRDGHIEPMSKEEMKEKLTEEIGDCLNALSTIATRYSITLEEAFDIHQKKLVKEYKNRL